MLQFVVLLAIMALWALTSLLSREAPPLPPRRPRGGLPEGPRAAPPGGRPDALAPARTFVNPDRMSPAPADRTVPARWSEASTAPRPAPARVVPGADDGILILESDNRGARSIAGSASSAGGATSRRVSPTRRGTRGRSPAAPIPPKQVEPRKPRALTTLVTQSMAQKRNKRLENRASGDGQLAPFAALGRCPDRAPRLAGHRPRIHKRVAPNDACFHHQAARSGFAHRTAPAAYRAATYAAAPLNLATRAI